MTEVDQEKLGELLSAYMDGELDEQQTQWVVRLLKENESARRLLNELQQTSQLVATLPRQPVLASIVEELQLHQERDELLGDPIAPQADFSQRRSPFKVILSVAAMITVVVTGALWMAREQEKSLPGPGGDVLAFADTDEEKTDSPQSFELDRSSRKVGETGSGRQLAFQRSSGANTSSAGTLQNKEIAAKLEAGINVQAIQTHAFAGEALRLKINTQSASDRDQLTARLVKHFSKRKVQNLANTPGRSTMNSRSGSFFYQGKPAVNFTNENQSQMIVRAPIEELNQLLNELSQEKDMDNRVTLAAGPLIFQGIAQARSSLQRHESADLSSTSSEGVSRSDQYRIMRSKKQVTASTDKSDRNNRKQALDENFYNDLFDVFGLDRTTVATMMKDSKPKAADASSPTETATQDGSSTNQTGVNQPMKIETLTSKSNKGVKKALPDHPQEFITFVVELNIDQPEVKSPAQSGRPTSLNTKEKSKSTSKSGAQ